MNFPLDLPVFRFLFWLVDTAGLGGLIALLIGGGSVAAYALVLRWISRAGQAEEKEVYLFPTPALHHHDEPSP